MCLKRGISENMLGTQEGGSPIFFIQFVYSIFIFITCKRLPPVFTNHKLNSLFKNKFLHWLLFWSLTCLQRDWSCFGPFDSGWSPSCCYCWTSWGFAACLRPSTPSSSSHLPCRRPCRLPCLRPCRHPSRLPSTPCHLPCPQTAASSGPSWNYSVGFASSSTTTAATSS